MNCDAWICNELETLRRDHLERHARVFPSVGGKFEMDGRPFLNFSSNDYLDLARHPAVIAAAREALERYGAGAASSRLVSGTLPQHEELERRLAALKGYPAALVFGAGWLANACAIPALVGRGGQVFADRLSHASLLDAVALSRAALRRFRHNDAAHLEELLCTAPPGRKLVITESVFSMDGDLAPLAEIAEAAGRHGAALMVDEAHATGVFGAGGSGRVRELGLESRVAVSMGTLSKALGSYGGFVACSEALRAWLVNRARAFIYTTAPPPAVLGAALGALDVLDSKPGLGPELLRRSNMFRARLRDAGLDTLASQSQIVPVLAGDNERVLRLAARLRENGIVAAAIRPPTVPAGTARLRLSVTLAHDEADLERAAEAVIRAFREETQP